MINETDIEDMWGDQYGRSYMFPKKIPEKSGVQ